MKKILLGDEMLFIFARTGGKTFGVDIEHVVSILEPYKLRQVPLAPSFVDTIMNYQGNIITLFDIREFYRCGAGEVKKEQKVIYLKHADSNIGLLFDEITKVDYLSPTTLGPPPEQEGSRDRPSFSKGVFIEDDASDAVEWLDGVKVQNFLKDLRLC